MDKIRNVNGTGTNVEILDSDEAEDNVFLMAI
jgi:hypothetical protein